VRVSLACLKGMGSMCVGGVRMQLDLGSLMEGITMCLLNTHWRTKCHTVDCARNRFLLRVLQKHLTSGTELILMDWKIVPNEEHVQCDHRLASQPLANEPLLSSQLFDTSLQKTRGTTALCGS